MREIKFRAFYDGTMIYGAERVNDALYWKKNGYQCSDLAAFKQENPAVLMEYIGFEDKLGEDVYELDILEDDFGRILLVEWRKGGFILKAITKTNFIMTRQIIEWFDGMTALPKIIGNSLENPEIISGVEL